MNQLGGNMPGAEQVRSRVTRKMVRELARDQIIHIMYTVVKPMDFFVLFCFLSLAGIHWNILSLYHIDTIRFIFES